MRVDPRCERLGLLSAELSRQTRRLRENLLSKECAAMSLPETLCSGDYLLLNAVGEAGCAVMAEIAKELNINPSTATRQVNRMLACGLVTKSASAEDERRYEICLTERGRLLLERMDEHRMAASRRVYEHTTEEELQTVYSCLEKEIEALRKLNEE